MHRMNPVSLLRPMINADFDVICEIRQDPHLLDLLMSYPDQHPISKSDAQNWIVKVLNDKHRITQVITKQNGEAIGYVQITERHRLGAHAKFGMVLGRQAQGKGFGKSALSELFAYCGQELGLRKLICDVRADNRKAKILYEKQGFAEAGCLKRHYRDLTDIWQDVLIMERFLK